LIDVGKLTLGVLWDGASVSGTDICSTRPMAAAVLTGKTPTQVMQIVPLLYSVCGRAQGAAANAAMHAAQQADWPEVANTERMIVCEALQEHLWRVMLDWPKLLGLATRDQQFAGWYALLRKIAAGETDMAVFLHEFERDGLGASLAEWREFDRYHALQAWWRKSDSPLAQLLAKLDELECGRHGLTGTRLLPAWSAANAHNACAGRWDAAFAAHPDWQGGAAETGAWTYHADSPILQDVWQQSGSKALTRLLARIWDVVAMASGSAAARLDAASPSQGEGVAVVRTARGLLMHHVNLAAEKVTDYVIVAPTEWNFHPDGAFAQDLRSLQESDAEHLKRLAHIEALSLDPCVAYEIEVRHA
jgi:hypothetical protein